MPDDLQGKTILTNTTRPADVEELDEARRQDRSSRPRPRLTAARSAPTSWKASWSPCPARKPAELTPDDYMGLLRQLNWAPRVQTLNG